MFRGRRGPNIKKKNPIDFSKCLSFRDCFFSESEIHLIPIEKQSDIDEKSIKHQSKIKRPQKTVFGLYWGFLRTSWGCLGDTTGRTHIAFGLGILLHFGNLGPSWERLGAVLKTSWGHLGDVLGRLGTSWGRLGGVLERLGGILGRHGGDFHVIKFV